MSRIEKRFKSLNGDKALVAFFTAGDPDLSSSKDIFSVVEKRFRWRVCVITPGQS